MPTEVRTKDFVFFHSFLVEKMRNEFDDDSVNFSFFLSSSTLINRFLAFEVSCVRGKNEASVQAG